MSLTKLRFSWAWEASAKNWRISMVDMGGDLFAGYDHMAGYYERQLIEEIERLRGQSPVDNALERAFHAEPQRTIVDDALRCIASPDEPEQPQLDLNSIERIARQQGVFGGRDGDTLTVTGPILISGPAVK